jgi:hypothetical protein
MLQSTQAAKVPVFLRKPSKELWDVDGAKTRVLWWKAGTRNTRNPAILFIPGNPGVIEYYEEYLQCLFAITQAQVDIIAGILRFISISLNSPTCWPRLRRLAVSRASAECRSVQSDFKLVNF